MTVSFHCFLIVTIFSPLALTADALLCGNKTKIRFEELCCDGRVYRIAEPSRALEVCNVEPKNATLTFEDSAWLAYDCNVRQRLNSTVLTLESYLNFLFRVHNTSQNQNLLWETLTFPDGIFQKIEGEDEHDKIQRIKLYQRECVQAIKEACSFGNGKYKLRGFKGRALDFHTRFSRMQNFFECKEEMLPYSVDFPGFDYTDPRSPRYDKCMKEVNHTMGSVTHYHFRNIIVFLCEVIESHRLDIESIQVQISKPTLDIQDIISYLFPGFWSKWVKNSVKNLILEELKQTFKAHDLESLESLMRNKVEEWIHQNLSDENILTNKHEIVQAGIILQIHNVFRKTTRNVCRVEAHRKEKPGV